MPSLNLGVLAHVDAGKTSLTERLLFEAGVIDAVGRVDDGSTQTDSLALEQQRGITIRSAVVSFTVGATTVNLVDTPGHSDFIAEVERVLGVLDGAVLVVSAVEGVQSQTRVLMRALQRLHIPTLVFVNKTDRAGADPGRVLDELRTRLSPAAVPYADDDLPLDAWVDALGDDQLLADYLDGRMSVDDARKVLAYKATQGAAYPVLLGSAVTGEGVRELMELLPVLLPGRSGSTGDPVHARVFKIERGEGRERVAYVDVRSGALSVRDRVEVGGERAKVTAISVFRDGAAVPVETASAGDVARVCGLVGARIGDEIGCGAGGSRSFQFAPPSLETVIDVVDGADRTAMYVGLTELAEQDPLIGLRQDDVRGEVAVSLYGEVQKEVIASMLADEHDVDVTFRETTTICIERVVSTGAAVEVIDVEPNPFLATVGLRVDPGPVGSGVRFELGVELGSMPPAFFAAVEEAIDETLREGLHGWPVTDGVVTMTDSGYWARQSHAHGTFDASMSSTAGDFRRLTPLVLMEALRRAGTVVCEPVHRFELEVPEHGLSAALSLLASMRAVPLETDPRGAAYVIAGDIPAAQVHGLQQRLPSVTSGEGVLTASFDRYEPAHSVIADRPRVQANPLDRRGYLIGFGRWHG